MGISTRQQLYGLQNDSQLQFFVGWEVRCLGGGDERRKKHSFTGMAPSALVKQSVSLIYSSLTDSSAGLSVQVESKVGAMVMACLYL